MKTKAFPLLFLLSAAPFAISFSQSTCPGGYVEDGDEIPCGLGNPCCTIEFACNGPNSVCNSLLHLEIVAECADRELLIAFCEVLAIC